MQSSSSKEIHKKNTYTHTHTPKITHINDAIYSKLKSTINTINKIKPIIIIFYVFSSLLNKIFFCFYDACLCLFIVIISLLLDHK